MTLLVGLVVVRPIPPATKIIAMTIVGQTMSITFSVPFLVWPWLQNTGREYRRYNYKQQ